MVNFVVHMFGLLFGGLVSFIYTFLKVKHINLNFIKFATSDEITFNVYINKMLHKQILKINILNNPSISNT